MVAGTAFVTLQGVGIKIAGERLGWAEIAFVRSLMLALAMLPIVWRLGAIKTRRPGLHFARGAVGIVGMSAIVFALTRAPLADVTAISFSRALFVVVLAIVILKETVGWRRWTAVIIGFLGVLLMVRPGMDGEFNSALLFAVGGAALGGVVVMLLRRLSTTERSETMVFYFGIWGSLLTAIPAALMWQWPTLWEWAVLVGLGLAGTVAQYFFARAWTIGEASAVAPIAYSQLIWAALLGLLLFDEVPDWITGAGAAVIVASTLYISIREARMKREAPAAKAGVDATT